MSITTTGQTWGALRSAWKRYKIAKVQHDAVKMKKASEQIRQLQERLGVPTSTFNVEAPAPAPTPAPTTDTRDELIAQVDALETVITKQLDKLRADISRRFD